jgi:hypothetical protein
MLMLALLKNADAVCHQIVININPQSCQQHIMETLMAASGKTLIFKRQKVS